MDILENNLFYNRIRFVDSFQLEMNSTVDDFKERFKENVIDYQESYGLNRPKTEFQGKIKRDSFTICRTFSLLEGDPIGASGTYSEMGEKLKVNVFVYLSIWAFIVSYTIILAIDILSIYFFITSGPSKSLSSILIFGTALSGFTLLWPYIFIRRNIRRLRNDLEKEFHYWYR